MAGTSVDLCLANENIHFSFLIPYRQLYDWLDYIDRILPVSTNPSNFCNPNVRLIPAFARYTDMRLWIMSNNIPKKFSRYEIREELGVGGMATVYRAYDPLFEREVALKILKRELLNDPQVLDRFERETKIVAKLEHAAIVPVYDVGHDNDQLFYLMRYMTGGSLSERILNGGMSSVEIAHIIQRIAAALDYAHDKGIVHRDLKPGNILFDEYNNPYISDFGIAKFAHAPIHLTSSGIIGTPTYMSPEQAQGEDVDGRSDIYSLGVILFEMLSGKTPFEATTPLVMAMKHATEPAPNILDINPNLPHGVDAVLEKVLAKDPNQRYSSAAEFANAFIATLPEPITSDIDLITPSQPRVRQIDSVTAAPSTPAGKLQPRTRLWILGGFVLLILAVFAIWRYSQAASTNIASTSTPETVTVTTNPVHPDNDPYAHCCCTHRDDGIDAPVHQSRHRRRGQNCPHRQQGYLPDGYGWKSYTTIDQYQYSQV